MAAGDVHGSDRLISTLHAAAGLVEDLDQVNDQAGGLVHGVAVRLAPEATGALIHGLVTKVTNAGVVWRGLAGHSVPVHFGTRVMTARPFYTDAITQTEGEITDLYTGHLTRVADTIQGD